MTDSRGSPKGSQGSTSKMAKMFGVSVSDKGVLDLKEESKVEKKEIDQLQFVHVYYFEGTKTRPFGHVALFDGSKYFTYGLGAEGVVGYARTDERSLKIYLDEDEKLYGKKVEILIPTHRMPIETIQNKIIKDWVPKDYSVLKKNCANMVEAYLLEAKLILKPTSSGLTGIVRPVETRDTVLKALKAQLGKKLEDEKKLDFHPEVLTLLKGFLNVVKIILHNASQKEKLSAGMNKLSDLIGHQYFNAMEEKPFREIYLNFKDELLKICCNPLSSADSKFSDVFNEIFRSMLEIDFAREKLTATLAASALSKKEETVDVDELPLARPRRA